MDSSISEKQLRYLEFIHRETMDRRHTNTAVPLPEEWTLKERTISAVSIP